MIRLRNVSKRFKLYQRPSDRLLEWVLPVRRHNEFFALRDISLDIPAGRTVGVVGQNGAGKSTLLKLITGTLLPSSGTLEIDGRVAALLELGTGFHHEFTGRQNIHVNGQLLGISSEELASLEPEIIAFSELGPFIDQPVRTYSSGMTMRLGFAIAAALRPELLIVDEALSVGDARFSQKCIRRIREFRDEGATILFVSHDPAAVTTLCDEAILLERGEMRSRGLPKDILEEYRALLAEKGAGNVAMRITRTSSDGSTMSPRRHGTFQALISQLEVCREDGRPTDSFTPGEVLLLRARVDFLAPMGEPTVGVLIKDRLGLEIFGTNTALQGVELGAFAPGEHLDLEMRVPLNLGHGDYSITVAVHEDETHLEACYEWTDNAAIFKVRMPGKPLWVGVAQLQASFVAARGRNAGEGLESALRERFGDVVDPLDMGHHRPSPFMVGFAPPDDPATEPTPARRIEREARFLFHPAGPRVVVLISTDEDNPVEVSLRSPTVGDLGRAGVDGGRHAVAFALPAELVGVLSIFDLAWRSHGPVAAPRVRVHGIRSTMPIEEGQQQWPITTSAKS